MARPGSRKAKAPSASPILSRLALSAAAGLCASLAWPGLNLWPLIFFAPALLFVAVEGLGAGRRFLVAWLGGAVAFGFTFHWVYVTMRDMTSFPPALAVVVLVAYAAAHGLLWALFGWALGPIRRHLGAAWFFVAAVAWALLEWFFPSVFPIFFGYALWSSHVLIQAADLVGVAGLSFLVVFVGGALADLRFRRGVAGAWFPRGAAAALLVLATAYGFLRPAQVLDHPVEQRLDIGVVQPNPVIAEKHSDEAAVRYRMLARALEQSEALLAETPPPDLIVWPEGGSPFTQVALEGARADVERGKGSATAGNLRERSARVFAELAGRTRLGITFGSLRRVGERTRNAAVHIPGDGGEIAYYDKVKLVPFGEYLPLSGWFPSLRGAIPGISDFEPGAGPGSVRFGEVTALPTICYENIFPGFVREGLQAGGQMLINYTNDMWFGATRALDLHLMAQAIRCVENRVPLVRATGTGVSAFVDATGRVTQATERLVATHLRGVVEIREVWSFYRSAGDVVFWALVLLALALVLRAWRCRPGTSPGSRCRNQQASGVGSPEHG